MTEDRFAAGDRVIYMPGHAYSDRGHPDCEHGVVSSLGTDGIVFVKFNPQIQRFGMDGATAKGCHEDSLVLERRRSPR